MQVTLAGRIRALRPMGKIAFSHIDDRAGRIQLFFRINDLGAEKMEELETYYDLGDFIQASGYMFRTKRGEVTLYVEDFKMPVSYTHLIGKHIAIRIDRNHLLGAVTRFVIPSHLKDQDLLFCSVNLVRRLGHRKVGAQ